MGFYLRKSVSVGPFRFNLSGSGVGVSVGVPGFRVGSGPRGNYVHLGRGGLYYRQTIPSGDAQPVRPAAPMLLPSGTHAPLEEVDSASASHIVDSTSEEILSEIREKHRKIPLAPFAFVAAILLTVGSIGAGRLWVFTLALICSVAMIVVAQYRDKIRKTVVILYDFDASTEEAFGRFIEWGQAFATSHRAWHVAASGEVYDRKYHAGASQLVKRNVTTLRSVPPPTIKTNVPVLSLGAGKQTLYFFPDRLLIYDAQGVGAIAYQSLQISVSAQNFIEDGAAPRDAKVVGNTWRYVNKSGGPDRRFSQNPQLPICVYDELHLRTPSGLNEIFHVSRAGVGEGFAAAVQSLASRTAPASHASH
jgi:hypothetical protein